MKHRSRMLVFLPMVGLLSIAAVAQTLFDEQADAGKQIKAAIAQASHEHKNIILDFGANWCLDCHILEAQMEKPDLAPLIEANYIVVKVDVGRFDKNLGVAKKYRVPLKLGIPALAVLDGHGKLLYSQEQGEFENARHMTLASIQEFFERWKPKK